MRTLITIRRLELKAVDQMQPDIALKLLESGGALLYNPVTKASTTEAIVVPLGNGPFSQAT